jgi:Short C-terminal domain
VAYLIKAGTGLALFFGSIVLFNVKLQELLDTGTCASGNVPFEIAPGYQCPEGTGTDILLVSASVFIGLIGAAIFAFRGDPPWGERRRSVGFFGLGTLAWGIFFAGTGAALLIGQPYGESVDPATGEVVGRPDSQLGSTIVGITFLVMGLPPLLLGLWSGIKGIGGRDERPAAAVAGAGGGGMMSRMSAGLGNARAAQELGARMPWGSSGGRRSSGDAIGKLERLQKLRESGAINDSEFEREKAKILAE